METRWVLLILTLLCMGSCSFFSSASSASLLAPIGAAVFGIACAIAFFNDRIGGVSRGDSALMSDPETLRLLGERAKAAAARNAERKAAEDEPAASAKPPDGGSKPQ